MSLKNVIVSAKPTQEEIERERERERRIVVKIFFDILALQLVDVVHSELAFGTRNFLLQRLLHNSSAHFSIRVGLDGHLFA